jgi:uncharacterized protein (DUF885 family)
MTDPQHAIADRYFAHLGAHFPVMCASDEFTFMPRAQAASSYYDRLDSLDADHLDDSIRAVKEFRALFAACARQEKDRERRLDLDLLHGSASAVLLELEQRRSWRYDPLLYLKVAFIGLDHALTKPASDAEERRARFQARLEAIPRLLREATTNLERTPESLRQAAVAMVGDCQAYLGELGRVGTSGEEVDAPAEGIRRARDALADFARFLTTHPPVADRDVVDSDLEVRLRDHFLSVRTPPEVFRIAQEEWHENLRALEALQRSLAPGRSWQELYHEYCPAEVEHQETIALYRREIGRLARFFRERGFGWADQEMALEIRETPTYLRSIRSAASFSAAFSADVRERSFFYITTRLPERRSQESGVLLRKRLHREYKFLAAHETVPGHQLLDAIRRRLENPVRRQIESPLFYEGWAYYAESLLTEYGYVASRLDELVDRKRRLWRAARCQIDVGLGNGMLGREEALRLLTITGFSAEEATTQLERFAINPGYQVCYSLGRYEIEGLRTASGARVDKDTFHKHLLEGGQLPFHLVARRLASSDLQGTHTGKE